MSSDQSLEVPVNKPASNTGAVDRASSGERLAENDSKTDFTQCIKDAEIELDDAERLQDDLMIADKLNALATLLKQNRIRLLDAANMEARARSLRSKHGIEIEPSHVNTDKPKTPRRVKAKSFTSQEKAILCVCSIVGWCIVLSIRFAKPELVDPVLSLAFFTGIGVLIANFQKRCDDCKRSTPNAAETCPHCHHQLDPWLTKLRMGCIALIVVPLTLMGAERATESTTERSARAHIQVGQVRQTKPQALICDTESTATEVYDLLVKASVSTSDAATPVLYMIKDGRVGVIEGTANVHIIRTNGKTSEVQVLSGDCEGQRGWMPNPFCE